MPFLRFARKMGVETLVGVPNCRVFPVKSVNRCDFPSDSALPIRCCCCIPMFYIVQDAGLASMSFGGPVVSILCLREVSSAKWSRVEAFTRR